MVTTPGWTEFNSTCAENTTPPGEGDLSIAAPGDFEEGVFDSLSCSSDQLRIGLEVFGGQEPFTWQTSAGLIATPDVFNSRRIVLDLLPFEAYVKLGLTTFVGDLGTACPDGPGNREERAAFKFSTAYDCFQNVVCDQCGPPPPGDVDWTGTAGGVKCNGTDTWPIGGGEEDVGPIGYFANDLNMADSGFAPDLFPTVHFTCPEAGVSGPIPEGFTNYLVGDFIDIRTPEQIAAGCHSCASDLPNMNILVTATDALNVSVSIQVHVAP